MITSALVTQFVANIKARCNNIDAFSGSAADMTGSSAMNVGTITVPRVGPVTISITRTYTNYTVAIVTTATVKSQLTAYLTSLGLYNASAPVTKSLLINIYNALNVFYSCKVKRMTVWGDPISGTTEVVEQRNVYVYMSANTVITPDDLFGTQDESLTVNMFDNFAQNIELYIKKTMENNSKSEILPTFTMSSSSSCSSSSSGFIIYLDLN
jgi:hypothetical protein